MDQASIKELDKILPVVARAHGDQHPELEEVKKLYEQLKASPDKAAAERLKEVTHDFTLPEDACPAYEKTYRHLSAMVKEII